MRHPRKNALSPLPILTPSEPLQPIPVPRILLSHMPRALFLILALALAHFASAQADPATLSYAKHVQPLLQTYCAKCHLGDHTKGDISLAPFANDDAVQSDPRLWRTVLTELGDYSMPPKSKPQPTPAQRELLIDYVTYRLNHLDLARLPKDPGRVTIHRLNRQEYNNTIRDLLGVNSHPADTFPADGGGGGGFDNNADTLFIPPILMEMYLKAAGESLAAASPKRLFPSRPDANKPPRKAARECLEDFLPKAFRRPTDPQEIDRYLKLFDISFSGSPKGSATDPFERALKLAYKAILISPNFLFRIEQDRPNTKDAYPISDFELASRLSYFLWASMPDDELFRLAKENKLHDDTIIDQQVRRMLKDPKSKALAEYFGGQWLGVNALLTTANPDRERFKKYTPQIRDSFYAQAIEFVDSIFREDRPITTLIDSDYTYLNEPIARLYQIDGIKGEEMRQVKFSGSPKGNGLPDKTRGGILGLGAVHVITSFPLRTSPVLRGKWILETVLGAPPPPPPPDVPKLPENDTPTGATTKSTTPLTIRQRLNQHRVNPACTSCHVRMDPLGFGMENFDPIGRWRTELAGQPIDTLGTLATGETFTGPAELKAILLEKIDDFARTLTQKLLAYALGRGLESYDEAPVKIITDQLAKSEYKSSTLIIEIAKSYPFRYRRN
jgi:hypothetical protein